jgi:hypothetical protein
MKWKKITINQGFLAMVKFLEKWHEFIRSDDIAFLLSGMNMDPAFLQDWVKSVEAVLQEAKEK